MKLEIPYSLLLGLKTHCAIREKQEYQKYMALWKEGQEALKYFAVLPGGEYKWILEVQDNQQVRSKVLELDGKVLVVHSRPNAYFFSSSLQ